jgi:CRISPR-associated protein Cas1
MLIEKVHRLVVPEARIRYHQSNVTVRIPIDDTNKACVLAYIERARELAQTIERPPVTDNENLCRSCSLAPVCLPEEVRLSHQNNFEVRTPIRLFPEDDDRKVIHVLESTASVGKAGNQIKISYRDERPTKTLPISEVGQVVLHGFSQMSTQCLRMCAENEVGVHFITGGGRYVGGVNYNSGAIQRKLRQYNALSDEETCLALAKRLVYCKTEMQRQVLMRFRRRESLTKSKLTEIVTQMTKMIRLINKAQDANSLLGIEGHTARLYFSGLPLILSAELPPEMQFSGRNKRPPRDPINCLLSYGYSFLLKDVLNAILIVGLEPALGFYHQPRSSAPPLALDLMELFRVIMVDMPVLNSINRMQWDIATDFVIAGQQVWLTDEGKRKLIAVYERRKSETWRHPAIGYSISYGRMFELEVRLLEKEWMEEGGLFARLRLR